MEGPVPVPIADIYRGQKEKESKGKKLAMKMGPWGGKGGLKWDDGSYDGVREITIFSSLCIDSISVVYDRDGLPVSTPKHGGDGGDHTVQVKLEYPEEKLICVSGHYGPLFSDGPVVVRSLTLQTNGRTFGPYGVEEGTSFCQTTDWAHIVGFHGKKGQHLNAIGLHLSNADSSKISPPMMSPEPNPICDIKHCLIL